MTMISPKQYSDNIKDLPYSKLIDERNILVEKLHKFEDKYVIGVIADNNSYDNVTYQMTNHYLVEVTKLLNEKFNQIVWSEE